MTEAILLLAPAVCATAIADRTRARRLSVRGAAYLAAWNAVLVNAVVWAAKCIAFGTGDAPLFPPRGVTAEAALKYLAVAIPAAAVAGFAEALLANRFRVESAPGGREGA